MRVPATRVALLLFASGFCALVYQVAWLRLLRLIFGASTAASAAVLAVFMAGLGAGGLVLGRRVDARSRPLRFYAILEVGIALAAAVSPWLVVLARHAYFGLGGSARLGSFGGTATQLVLATLVLGLPTFLMGGTLPAAARAVERASDEGRRLTALLYGVNSLGAVCGALVATFVALETLGVTGTIWAAGLLNLLVAAVAFALAARHETSATEDTRPRARSPVSEPAGPVPFILGAAAVTGFAFLLMELVWYRMLAPVLGGSSYSFGLILAVALTGVGAGGLLYGVRAAGHRPTLSDFATTCGAEALLLLLPWVLGDRIAVAAMLLRPLGDVSFGLLIAAWSALTAVVVLPAAVVAGYQFPLLIALLGAGREKIGRQVGAAYACNTAGAVAGAVAGGFGLMALTSALSLWFLTALLLMMLAAAAVCLDYIGGARRRIFRPVLISLFCLAPLFAPPPSAVWRHTPTGAGGMPASFDGPGDVRRMSRAVRRAIVWEREGRESSVAIHGLDGLSILLNGKADGSALADAPTQVMSTLIGAALHPEPRRALVIGLGTGSSAGWLADFPGIEEVEVVELEPAVLEMARRCAPVNRDALAHPKVQLRIGDGREHLLTSRGRYDLIFSEPSNPYRAGISSLFTRELYAAADARLNQRGVFLQWLQSYHVDAGVARTVTATLASVFPHVESWQVHSGDLLLVASREPIDHDLARIRGLVSREPLASAMRDVLGVEGVEGFYTGFVASAKLAHAIREQTPALNTDDHPIVEFGFARGLGRDLGFSVHRLAALAAARGEHLPKVRGGNLDWLRVLELRGARDAHWGLTTPPFDSGDPDFDQRAAARNAYVLGDLDAALRRWRAQSVEPASPLDRLLLAEALAEAADPSAPEHAAQLAENGRELEAAAVAARYQARTGRPKTAAELLAALFLAARDDPWIHRPTLERSLQLASSLAAEHPGLGLDLFGALGEPFAVRLLDEARLETRLEIAQATAFAALCEEALAPFEPDTPWEEPFLTQRLLCYETTGNPLANQARRELEAFIGFTATG
ncbi:MAG: spermidine synthase [bacterium]|nr:spermidine synthase [bacterium]